MKRKWRLGVAAALLAGGLAVALPGNVHAEEKGIEINETNFPDERFREYVKQFDTGGDPYYWFYLGDEDPEPEFNPNSPDFNRDDWEIDENPDGYLSEEELAVVTEMDLSPDYYKSDNLKIESLKGIEFFTELERLTASYYDYYSYGYVYGHLEDLDLSHNTKLEYLNLSGQGIITGLNLSHNLNLKELVCVDCDALESVDFGENKGLLSIDLTQCRGMIEPLDVQQFEGLTSLSVNTLLGMDLSKNTELVKLECGGSSSNFYDLGRDFTSVEYVLDLRNNTKLNYVDIGGYSDHEECIDYVITNVWMPEKTTVDVENPPFIRIYGPDVVDLRHFNTDAGGEETVESYGCVYVKSDADLGWHEGDGSYYYQYETKCYVEETGNTPDTLQLAHGLREIDGKKYYFDEAGLTLVNDIAKIDGVECYFGKDGVMQDALPDGVVVGSYNFPDSIFEGWVYTKVDTDKDGILSEAEYKAVTKFQGYFTGAGSNGGGDGYTEVYDGWDAGICYTNFKGIEFFPNLKLFSYYDCSFNGKKAFQKWAKLDLSKNTLLEEVYISGIVSLKNGIDISGCKNLKVLILQTAELGKLDVSKNKKLTYLDIGRSDYRASANNEVSELNLSANTKLEFLDISFNPIASVDIRNLTALKEFHCEGMGMPYDGTAGSILGVAVTGKGSMTALDISANTELEILWCGLNQLTQLNTDNNPKLRGIACAYNNLSSLDFSKNPELEYLNCYGNKISKLEITGTKLIGAEVTNEASLNLMGSEEPTYGEDCFYNGQPFPEYIVEDTQGQDVTKNRPLNTDKGVSVVSKLKAGWTETDAGWKYVNVNGEYVTGWQKIGKKWYYFNKSGVMQTGWQKIGKKWYYFNKSGAMLTGWQQISKKWYYFNASGEMLTGWQQISKKWYYFNASGVMLTGWQTISKKTYFFKTDGSMAANEYCKGYWLNKDGTWTYKPKASWKKDKKGWYFIDTKGWYAKNGTWTIDGKKYTFDAKGYMK